MPFLTQPSQFILAWDRHQICWLAYPVAWLNCENKRCQIILHVKLPMFRAAKLKSFPVTHREPRGGRGIGTNVHSSRSHVSSSLQHLTLSQSRITDYQYVRITSDWNTILHQQPHHIILTRQSYTTDIAPSPRTAIPIATSTFLSDNFTCSTCQ